LGNSKKKEIKLDEKTYLLLGPRDSFFVEAWGSVCVSGFERKSSHTQIRAFFLFLGVFSFLSLLSTLKSARWGWEGRIIPSFFKKFGALNAASFAEGGACYSF
jgi:hypothetical protein